MNSVVLGFTCSLEAKVLAHGVLLATTMLSILVKILLEFKFTAVMAPGNVAAVGSLLYLTPSGQAALADASSLATARVAGAATTVATSGTTVTYTSSLPITSLSAADVVDGAPSNLTPGALYYLSSAVPGNYTTTPDTTTSGAVLIQVGVALDTNEMNIEISAPLVI